MKQKHNRIERWFLPLTLILMLLMASCASEVSLTHTIKSVAAIAPPQLTKSLDSEEALKVFKPEPVFIQQKGPQGTIISEGPTKVVRGIQTKNLTISMNFSNSTQIADGFKTQALRCSDFVKLKVQITGIAIGAPMFPAGVDGNDNIDATAGCTIAATIANVPFGNARIATVAAYQADGTTIIPGSTVKAVFNVTADPTNVTIGYHTTPTATAIEAVVASNDFIGAYIAPATLQSFVDTETGVSGTFPDFTYTYHPSLIDSAQLGADLIANSGNVGGLTAGDYDNEAFSSVTGTLAGLLGTDTASIQVTDPASPISINNGNGAFSFTSNVKNGTWVVHAEHPNYTADVQPATTIAAGASDAVGTITFTWANTPNIGSLSSSAEPIGTSININGTNFHPETAGNTVTFNGVPATVTAASPTQLTVTVPSATDGNVVVTVGTVASNGVNFDVMPTVNITAPAAAAVVNGLSSAITTSFTSGNSVTQVEFFLDGTGGTSLGTDATGPSYTLNWDTTAQTSGAHTLVAQITDDQGNTSDSPAIAITIDQFPNIASVTPNTGTAPGLAFPIQIVASASDDISALPIASYTWSCITNCGGGHTFDRTDSNTVIWTAPTSNVGPVTVQVSVNDGVNTAVTDTVVLNYAVGTATTNVVGTSTLEEVSTYAGNGTGGTTAGSQTSAALSAPRGLAFDSAGNLFFTSGHLIRQVFDGNIAFEFAGQSGSGYNDATGSAAQFNGPRDIAIDSSNNIFVADRDNQRIRKITPAGVVTTFAGDGTANFNDATGIAAQFNNPEGLAIDSSDNLYVADTSNNRIRKITPAGVVTTFAGDGVFGFTDGAPGSARFKSPREIAIDGSDNLYIADRLNHSIRKIDAAGTTVSTLAGNGFSGYVDATGGSAQFNAPIGVAVDSAGNVFVSDSSNHVIRKITPGGVVTTFAGLLAGNDFADGLRIHSKFKFPQSIAILNDILYIADQSNNRIRRVIQ